MQFKEPDAIVGKCPICGKDGVIQRSTRGKRNYCSRTCQSQARYATRYTGSLAGPMDKPTLKEKTKLP